MYTHAHICTEREKERHTQDRERKTETGRVSENTCDCVGLDKSKICGMGCEAGDPGKNLCFSASPKAL